MSKKYQIIYCDPAWHYSSTQHSGSKKNGGKSNTGGAMTHYPTLDMDTMKTLNVQDIAEDDSLMFMWVCSPLLKESIEVMEAWGFDFVTVGFVWHKGKTNPGTYTMSQVEMVLIGKRKKGKIPQPRGARNIRQFFKKERTKHSEKPLEFMHLIDRMFPTQTKIELFARRKEVDGWDFWGNEVNPDVQLYFDKSKYPAIEAKYLTDRLKKLARKQDLSKTEKATVSKIVKTIESILG